MKKIAFKGNKLVGIVKYDSNEDEIKVRFLDSDTEVEVSDKEADALKENFDKVTLNKKEILINNKKLPK